MDRLAIALLLVLVAACKPSPATRAAKEPRAASPPSASSAVSAPAKVDDSRREALLRALEDVLRASGTVGMSVAVIDRGDLVLEEGFGSTEIGGPPVTRDTPFFIASITKTFTGVLAAMAVDDGALAFDDAPRKYVPGFHLSDPAADSVVTLRDLLSHRSGLPQGVPDDVVGLGALTFDELLGLLARVKLAGAVGARFQYSNAAFGVAGEAIANAEKTTYAELLTRRVLLPLGMTSTSLVTPATPDAAKRVVPGYLSDGTSAPVAVQVHLEPALTAAAGGLRSTARDMARWLGLLIGAGTLGDMHLLRRQTFEALLEPQVSVSPGVTIGLPFWVRSWRGHRLVWHNGGNRGAVSTIAFLPDDGVGFVMMRNTDDEPHNGAFVRELCDLVFSTLLPDATPGPAPAPPPADEHARAWAPLPPGSPSVDVVMAKAIAAVGGEANLRRHHASETFEVVTRSWDDIVEEVRVLREAPAMFYRERAFTMSGRRLGAQQAWFDGEALYLERGGPLDRPDRLPPGLAAGTRETSDFFGDLHWRTLWNRVELRGIGDVDGEPALVVVKTTSSGATVTDSISTRTFLPLRREDDDGVVTFADWRWVDGVRIPFRRDMRDDIGDSTARVRRIRFDVNPPGTAFRPPAP